MTDYSEHLNHPDPYGRLVNHGPVYDKDHETFVGIKRDLAKPLIAVGKHELPGTDFEKWFKTTDSVAVIFTNGDQEFTIFSAYDEDDGTMVHIIDKEKKFVEFFVSWKEWSETAKC